MSELLSKPAIGAIEFDKGQDIDPLLRDVVSKLKSAKIRIAGFLQLSDQQTETCADTLSVQDIETGLTTKISQPLGPGARGCRLNPVAMAEAASSLMTKLENSPHLLVLNRFGRGEIEGGGFRQVIERAVELGVPVLIAVRDPYTEGLKEFCGGYSEPLPQDHRSVVGWCVSRVLEDAAC